MEISIGGVRNLGTIRYGCFLFLVQILEGGVNKCFRSAFGCRGEGESVLDLPGSGLDGC